LSRVTAVAQGDAVQLQFGHDPWLIAAAKSVPGARLAPGGWIVPRSGFPAFCLAVGTAAITIDPALIELVPADPFENTKPTEVLGDLRPLRPTWGEQNTLLGLTSADYQATGTSWLITHPRALLLDEMGLGKSKQLIDAVAYVHQHNPPLKRNVLIVAKASSVSNWRNELEMFSIPCDITLLRGPVTQRRKALVSDPQHLLRYFVVSWQTMRADIDELGRKHWDWIVLDEAHLAKSTPLNDNQARQASAIHALQAKRKTAMTGSFIVNSAEDSWNVLSWLEIDNREWKVFERETLKVISYSPGGFKKLKLVVGYKPDGLVKLRGMIGNSMIRRIKDEEMPALPPYIRTNVEVLLNTEEALRYRSAEKRALLYLDTLVDDDGKEIDKMTVVMRLKQITSSIGQFMEHEYISSKTATAASLVEDLVSSGKKVLIGSQFLSVIAELERELTRFNPAVVTGNVTMAMRDRLVKRFQTDPECHVFIASVAACREAINLTAASAIIHIDKEWSQAYVDQFEARARRIGSEAHNGINVYSLLAMLPPSAKHLNGEKTIDHGIESVLDKKERHADNLTQKTAAL
jgi:SNF2 family DNA or RNA helicase